MFSEATVLIAEDNLYVALDLSSAVEEMDGRVIGPASTVAEALALLARHDIAGAIVDSQLGDRDVAPLARQLAERGVPFVIHACTRVPSVIADAHPDVPVLMKPLQPSAVLTCLLNEMRKSGFLPRTHPEIVPAAT
jgi:DNA-binding NarL/FixJ family response regulator